MKQEIRQNGKTVLYSGDGHSIPMIFNNLVGKNLKGREYSDYIAFVAIPDMGFTYGKIAYYSDGTLGENMCYWIFGPLGVPRVARKTLTW